MKKTMKRSLALLLCLILAFSVLSVGVCAGDEGGDSDSVLELTRPVINVAEKDGDLVTKLTMDFDWYKSIPVFFSSDSFDTDAEEEADPVPPAAVDMDKEIELQVQLIGIALTFRAVPVDYSDGVLTVELYDGDQKGVPLHGIQWRLTISGQTTSYDMELTSFTFTLPEGMFSDDDGAVNAETAYRYSSAEIGGIPYIDLATIKVPGFLENIKVWKPLANVAGKTVVSILVIIHIPDIVRGFKQSYGAYGLDFYKLFFTGFSNAIRDGWWIDVVKACVNGFIQWVKY